ncbi:MAG TPA: two-component regulator propeller domain-containing protein [Niastella sp.]
MAFAFANSQSKFHLTFIKGLPNNHIRASAQTEDGFLWLGSENGLYRYNGYQFEVFNDVAKGPTRLSSPHIMSLLADGHLLWIGTANGLNYLDLRSGRVQSWLVAQQIAITSMAKTKQGNMIAGDVNGNVFVQDGRHFRLLTRLPGYANMEPSVHQIIVTGNDMAWMVQAGNLTRLHVVTGAVSWEYRHTAGKNSWNAFTTKFINNTQLLLSHKKEVAIINTQTLAFEQDPFWQQFGRQHGTFVFFNQQGRVLWLTNDENQFFAFDQQVRQLENVELWKQLDPGAYMPYHLFSFDEDGFWLCTSGGLVRLSRTPSFLHSINLQSPASPQMPITTRAFFPGRRGLYVSSYTSAILLDTVNNTCQSFPEPLFAPAQTMAARDGKLYIASEFHGFCKYDPVTEKVEQGFYNNPNHVTISEGLSLLPVDDNKILIGAGSGLYVYSPKTNTLNPPAYHHLVSRFPAKRIFAIERAPDGKIWLATQQGLFCMDSNLRLLKQYTHATRPALHTDNIRALFISKDNKVITGTFGGGVQVLDPATNNISSFTSWQGLPDDVIYSIVPENDSICWLGTGHGLSRFNFRLFSCNNYYQRDGLINEEFNTHSTWRATNGTIYMGVMGGVVYFDPAAMNLGKNNVRIHITGIQQTGRYESRQWFGGEVPPAIQLRPTDKILQFEFALSDISSPAENRFQYKLEGVDNDWNYLGSQNILRIYNLPAGRFTLRIRGMAPDGSVTQNEIRVPVRVIPWFYKTGWFYILVLVIVSAGLWLIYRYRIRQMKKILHLRNKIARDLHDDIGSTLSGISILSSITQKEITSNPTRAQQQLQQIGTDAREMLHNMSDIIWSVNPQHDQLEHSFVRMRQFVAQTLEASNIDVQIRFDEQLETLILPMEMRRNLYLIFKEAINNITKYAKAGQVLIVLEKRDNQLLLLIKDNGKGFHQNQVTKGNGLKNIQQRAAEINATVTIESVPGKGTTLQLQAPVP